MSEKAASARRKGPRSDVTFHYRINDGKESQITVKTGIYQFAALALPAVTGKTKLPITVEIWCPHLLPEYGPIRYEIYDNEFGCPTLRHLVAIKSR